VFKLKHFPQWIVGPPRDPVDPGTRRGLLLTAVLASAGLGANGLSSACYGPEKAFLALRRRVGDGVITCFGGLDQSYRTSQIKWWKNGKSLRTFDVESSFA
jgi:hypothetical protein